VRLALGASQSRLIRTLKVYRNGASLLAKAFGVGFIVDWLGFCGFIGIDLTTLQDALTSRQQK